MLGEERHNVVLGLGQLDLLPGHKHLTALIVDLQVLCRKRPGGQAARRTVAVDPQGGPDTCQQLAGAKGLGNIIVGPQVQRLDLILLRGAGRKHHDRSHVLLAHGADQLQTVPVGQTQIQDHEVGVVGGKQGQAHGAGVRHQCLIAVGLQQRLNEAANIGLIFHHKDLEFIIAHLRSPPSRFLLSLTRTEWPCPHRVCFRL